MALRLVRMQNHALQLCMWQKWTQTRTKSNEKAPSKRLRGGCQALHMKVPRGQLYQQVPANMLPWSHWVTVETQAIWWQMPWRISPVRCAVDLNPSWVRLEAWRTLERKLASSEHCHPSWTLATTAATCLKARFEVDSIFGALSVCRCG